MIVKFDIEAIEADKTLADLSWEIVEARGIDAGDTVALWDIALKMGHECANAFAGAEFWADFPTDDEDQEDVFTHVSATYHLLAKYIAQDARQIVKFLKKRGFEFPEEHIGKRPDEGIEL